MFAYNEFISTYHVENDEEYGNGGTVMINLFSTNALLSSRNIKHTPIDQDLVKPTQSNQPYAGGDQSDDARPDFNDIVKSVMEANNNHDGADARIGGYAKNASERKQDFKKLLDTYI